MLTASTKSEHELDEAPGDVDVPCDFQIRSESAANYVVRKITEARQYRTHVEEWAQSEIRQSERAEAWLLRQYEPHLNQWLTNELEERGGRRRSVNLPAGSLGFRAEPARIVVVSDKELLAWCQRHLPDAVQVRTFATGAIAVELQKWASRHAPDALATTTILKSVVNDYAFSSGEIPDGANVRPRHDVLHIR